MNRSTYALVYNTAHARVAIELPRYQAVYKYHLPCNTSVALAASVTEEGLRFRVWMQQLCLCPWPASPKIAPTHNDVVRVSIKVRVQMQMQMQMPDALRTKGQSIPSPSDIARLPRTYDALPIP